MGSLSSARWAPLLHDLMSHSLLEDMISEGYVKRQVHPTGNLAILNYTAKAQYDRVWNEVTLQTRGLIYNPTTRAVVSRPFPKFFNVGELSDEQIPAEPFQVFEKLDGSLGILYEDQGGHAIATRGSFASDQARWATDWLRAGPRLTWRPNPAWTYLFEIIYPENRIVVNYGDRAELVLIEVLETLNGRSVMKYEAALRGEHRWPGARVKEYDGFDALESLLAAEQPLNEEGYVIRFQGGMRAKVKHDEYVRLHRIVTGVSTKTVWEYLSQGKSFEDLLDHVPDEFYDWIQHQAAGLVGAYEGIKDRCLADLDEALALTSMNMTVDDGGVGLTREFRKEFALRIKDHPDKDILFLMLDNKDFNGRIWDRIKPKFEKPFIGQTEDVA